MSRLSNLFPAFCLFISLVFVPAYATDEPLADAERELAGYEIYGKNALAVFLGVTREDGDNLETFGIEYSYRISQLWSIGGGIERADREKDSTLAIAFAHLWPYRGLFLGAGIGWKDPGGHTESVFRGTVGYEFELSKGWSIAPSANLDVIEETENEEVYGIAIGKRF